MYSDVSCRTALKIVKSCTGLPINSSANQRSRRRLEFRNGFNNAAGNDDMQVFTAMGIRSDTHAHPDAAGKETQFIPSYLWGNQPALGITPMGKDIVATDPRELLFAASGDLRDSVTILNGIRAKHDSEGIKGEIKITSGQ